MAIYQSPTRRAVKEVDGILFTLNVGAINASTTHQYNIEDRKPAWAKYLPFNSMTIINNSGSNITVMINQDAEKATYVPAGVIKTVTGYGIIAFSLVTDTTAVADKEIQMDFERTGMVVDSFTKALASNVFFQSLMGIRRS